MSRTGPDPDGVDDLRALLPPLAGLDLVDLGCRDGSFARWAVARGATSVLALDLDADALDAARDQARRRPGPQDRIHFEQADLEQATLPFEAYDVAVCQGLLDRLEDPVRFARMVRSGLRQHGLVVCTLSGPEARDRAGSALERAGLDLVTPSRADGIGSRTAVIGRKPPRRRA